MSTRSRSPAYRRKDMRGPESRAQSSSDTKLYFKSARRQPEQELRQTHADDENSSNQRAQQGSHQAHKHRGVGFANPNYTGSRRPVYTAPRARPRPSHQYYDQASYARPHIGIGDAVRDVRDSVREKIDDWDARLEAWCNRPPMASSRHSGPVEATPGRVLGKAILMPMYAVGKGLSACVDAFATGYGYEHQPPPPRYTSIRHERRPEHHARPREDRAPPEDLPEDVAPPIVKPIRRRRGVKKHNGWLRDTVNRLTTIHPKDLPEDHPARTEYERRRARRTRP